MEIHRTFLTFSLFWQWHKSTMLFPVRCSPYWFRATKTTYTTVAHNKWKLNSSITQTLLHRMFALCASRRNNNGALPCSLVISSQLTGLDKWMHGHQKINFWSMIVWHAHSQRRFGSSREEKKTKSMMPKPNKSECSHPVVHRKPT